MTAYAIANLQNVDFNDDVVRYLEEIDATLAPFEGRFVIHGGEITVAEGEWPGTLIVIEFPTREAARGWYESDAYQAILPLRTDNSEGSAILVDGVEPGHKATDVIPPGMARAA
jgi:uncharacterized protein (DUF1330 family)